MPVSNILTILALASGAVYLFLAIGAWFRPGPTPKAGRSFAGYALLSSAWMVSQAVWLEGWLAGLRRDFIGRLPLYLLLGLAVLYFATTRLYLRRSASGLPWLLTGGAALAVLVWTDASLPFLPVMLWSRPGWALSTADLLTQAAGAGWGLLMGAATLITLQTFRRTAQPLFRNRVRYLAPTLLFLTAGEALFLAGYWTAGSLLRLPGVLILAYASLSDRLPSLRRAFNRTMSLLLTRGLAVSLYAALFWAVERIYANFVQFPAWQVSLLTAALLVMLLQPWLNRILAQIDRRIVGTSLDPTLQLRQYSQEISGLLDLHLLADAAATLTRQTVGAQHGFLFLVEAQIDEAGAPVFQLRGVKGLDEVHLEPVSLSESNPAAQRFRLDREPLARDRLEALFAASPHPADDMAWITHLELEFFIPVHKGGEWIGLLALGPKLTGEPYWDDERHLLATLADQTAVALENTHLVESLIRLNNEFRRAIAALNQANRDLERLDRTKTDFISIASHELLTPLTVISGYSQMLMDDPNLSSNPYYSKIMRGMHNGAQRLNEIVEGMLDLAKIDTQALSLDPQPVSLTELIQSLQEHLQPAINERRQQLNTGNLAELPPVEADRSALVKVFRHLLVNAIKYTPDGGRISLNGRTVPRGESGMAGGAVQITVSDTGVGIDPAFQEIIFNKFYQTGELELHSSGKTKFKGGGPGLGLAIVKGIVEAHGGRVWVESPGYDETTCPGSKFHVLLPQRQPRLETARSIVSP